MKGFRVVRDKFYPNVKDQVKVEKQLLAYRKNEGLFADSAASATASEVPRVISSEKHLVQTLERQNLVMKVLSQVTCALACERKSSTFHFIHSRKRNRLTSSRSNDFVCVQEHQVESQGLDPDYKESYNEYRSERRRFVKL